MHRVEVISYPRSGYHLVKNLVKKYFTKEFKPTTIYSDTSNDIYNNSSITFQKNHDLQLSSETKNSSNIRYLVMVRYPLESIVSYYKLQADKSGIEKSQSGWEYFALKEVDRWIKFHDKWVLGNIENRHVLNYGDLIDNPYAEIEKVIRFLLEDDREIDTDKISSIASSSDIGRKNNVCDVIYYNERFFDGLRGRFEAIKGVDIARDILKVTL